MQTGTAETLVEGCGTAVLCAGPVANRAVEAAAKIKAETGWTPSVYNIRYIKPLDTGLLDNIHEKYEKIITVEDGALLGGLHGAVAEYMSGKERPVRIVGVGIPDRYVSQGTQEELRRECGLTTEDLYTLLKKENEKNLKKD